MAYENDTMKMKALADAIEEKKKPDGSCLIGFDGYIDELYSVVQKLSLIHISEPTRH